MQKKSDKGTNREKSDKSALKQTIRNGSLQEKWEKKKSTSKKGQFALFKKTNQIEAKCFVKMKKKIKRKHFAHKIIYPKSTPCRKNSLLKESFAKGIAYFL